MARVMRWIPLLVVALAALALPQLTEDEGTLTTALVMFIIASLSSSWNILGGFAGQVSLGHAAFFGMGSLVTRLMWLDGTPLLLSVLAGGLVAAVAALILGFPGLRLKGIYFSIGSLALAEAIRITVGNFYPTVSALPGEALRNYDLVPRYYLALAVLILTVVVSIYLTHSKLGLGMFATREDEDAARAIGVNVFLHKLTALVISATLAGFAGGAFAFFHVSYYPTLPFGPTWTFDALIVTFIGGVGTIAGPLIGAAFFILVRDVLAANLVNIHLLIFGVLFILVVLLLPGGLLEGWEQLMAWRRSLMRSSQRTRDQAT